MFLIFKLKKAKIDLMKKQKDAAAQFKSFMDLKDKELITFKKTRDREKRETSKLICENQKLHTLMSRKVRSHRKVNILTQIFFS